MKTITLSNEARSILKRSTIGDAALILPPGTFRASGTEVQTGILIVNRPA